MKNWTFKQWNNLIGWVVFIIAFITYLSTIEPNFSFWDCGEYIASAVKLEVTHAPGAALFQILGAVAAIFAFGKGENYSLVINGMSALFSALTILFLFWTITNIGKRLISKNEEHTSFSEQLAIIFSGVIGALCFTFSDTFWYSAVEGEVYSMASMFIALLVWLITKWENNFLALDNEKWIILIFFTIGLSVGVHMMCMLAIPAICFIYYARKYEFTWKSFIWANVITLLILAIVFKGIFPFVMTCFGKLEIFAVNGLGMPFHSGTIIAFILMVAICYFLISYSRKLSKNIYQTIALSIVFMMIGFSCWLVIPIRANANPPMNLNDPDNAIGMLDYYNREQYGDWPTIYGQNYTAFLDANGIERNEDGTIKKKVTGSVYEKDEATGTYRVVNERFNYVFKKSHVGFFPRMFNENEDVMQNYISMYGAPNFDFNYENEDALNSPEAKQIFDDLRTKYDRGEMTLEDYMEVKPYGLINIQKPSFSQNFNYFIDLQVGYYFVRYLMWNFVGRQNDLEGSKGITKGNWISGIDFIDEAFVGNQANVPAKFKNDSTVKLFFLPLILGIIGFLFQLNRDFKRFYALLALFILTSVGIIFYTGVKPFEPRERDYAMVGSFYAFAIWIGLGAAAIFWYLQQKVKSSAVPIITGVVLLGIPLMMGFQNYRPHDRSERFAAYDYAYSVLNSLPKDNILFVYGDNDTYPVWAIQETEGFRDDVKVVNFTLLATPWNIDQVKRRTYNAMPVPGQLKHEDYRESSNDQVYLLNKERWQGIFANLEESGASPEIFSSYRKYLTQDSMTVKEALAFLKDNSEDKQHLLKLYFGENDYTKYNILPVSKFIIPVNKQNAIKSGALSPKDIDKAVDYIPVNYQKSTLYKNNLILLDILANFDWKRTINFSTGGMYDKENIFFLQNYLQYDGFSYRLVPIYTQVSDNGEMGRVDALSLYNTVKNYRWGNFKNPKVHYDETATSNIMSYRLAASRAAEALVAVGDRTKAIEILDLASREIPAEKYNDPLSLSAISYGYIVAGQEAKGLQIADMMKKSIFEEFDYYMSLEPNEQKYLRRAIAMKPLEYQMVTSAVVDAYEKSGKSAKAYDYVVKSLEPIDKKFKIFIQDLEALGREKASSKANQVQNISPFYQYMFEVMDAYDSTYSKEKQQQLTTEMMRVTQ